MPRLRPDQVTAAIKSSVGKPMRKISDGHSLYLITRNGRGYWSYQWRDGSTFRTKLLGSAADVSPAQARRAREEAAVARRSARVDRRGAVNRAAHALIPHGSAVPATGEAAGELLSDLLIRYLTEAAPKWKSGRPLLEGRTDAEIAELVREGKAGKEALSYTTMFNRLPDFLKLPAQSINPLAYRNAVKAIWPDSAPTVERMVKRRGTLLEYQRSGKHRGSAPKAVNHPAMPYADVPEFMRYLAGRGPIGARALRWTILAAARTDETLGAIWREITTIDGKPVWKIDGDRMKGELPHVVPLTAAMLALLGKREADDAPLFRGAAGGFANKGTMYQALTRKHPDLTVHGFRSSFRSWAGDCTDFPREIAEKALAHVVGGVEGAYDRGAKLAKRRQLMEAWSEFCTGSASRENVAA